MKIYTIESESDGVLFAFDSKEKRNEFLGYDPDMADEKYLKQYLAFEPYKDVVGNLKSNEWRKPLIDMSKKYRNRLPEELKQYDDLEFNECELNPKRKTPCPELKYLT